MRLILNGDDFGITYACNAAIIDCYTRGVLTSASLMVNMPAAPHAARLMKKYPRLSVGIHLNLTVGKPLTPGLKTLVKEDGTFNKGMLQDSSHVDEKEIRAELQAQMDRYIELTGQLPDHINSHHGIELIKGAEAIVCEMSRGYDRPVRRFFTLPEGNHKDIDFEIPGMRFAMKPDAYSDPSDLINMFSKEELNSDQIFEYANHPGYVDYEILQFSSLTTGRAYDAHVFLSPEVKAWLKAHPEIEVCDYRAIRKLK